MGGKVKIRERYQRIRGSLNERSRRLFAASEAAAYGRGGILAVSEAIGMSRSTIGKGLKELREIEAGHAPADLDLKQANILALSAVKASTVRESALIPSGESGFGEAGISAT